VLDYISACFLLCGLFIIADNLPFIKLHRTMHGSRDKIIQDAIAKIEKLHELREAVKAAREAEKEG
jgi:hypothetical protein